jgi:hypothetical protein
VKKIAYPLKKRLLPKKRTKPLGTAPRRYHKVVDFFDKVIAMGTTRNGKSYYFKTLCLGLLGQQPAAFASMRLVAVRNFSGAAEYLKANCP